MSPQEEKVWEKNMAAARAYDRAALNGASDEILNLLIQEVYASNLEASKYFAGGLHENPGPFGVYFEDSYGEIVARYPGQNVWVGNGVTWRQWLPEKK